MSKRLAPPRPFVMHDLQLRESPAWRALPDNARRALDRLEVELMRHAAYENGSLQCTYSDFAKAGIRRASIPLALRQLVELGFIEIKQGRRAISKYRNPSLYRLTHLFSRVTGAKANMQPTHEWHNIKTDEEAQAALQRAAQSRNYDTQPPRKNQKAGRENATPIGRCCRKSRC
jgi:hypothetical protein